MTDVTTMDACIRDVLSAGADDFLYLAEAMRIVESVSNKKGDELKALTLEVLGEILRRGLMDAGDLSADRFQKWDITAQECVDRIRAEWTALGREPSLGEVCWLRNTPKGDSIVA